MDWEWTCFCITKCSGRGKIYILYMIIIAIDYYKDEVLCMFNRKTRKATLIDILFGSPGARGKSLQYLSFHKIQNFCLAHMHSLWDRCTRGILAYYAHHWYTLHLAPYRRRRTCVCILVTILHIDVVTRPMSSRPIIGLVQFGHAQQRTPKNIEKTKLWYWSTTSLTHASSILQMQPPHPCVDNYPWYFPSILHYFAVFAFFFQFLDVNWLCKLAV